MKLSFKKLLMLSAISLAMLPANADAMASRDAVDNDRRAERVEDRILERIFTEYEREEIEDYFDEYYDRYDDDEDEDYDGDRKGKKMKKGLPPGLAKRDRLPPGLEKQLERNGRLPPGLEKRMLPDDLEDRLPERADNLMRRIIGDDVVLIDEDTDLILDIIRGALRD